MLFTALSFGHRCEPDSVTGAHTLCPLSWEAPGSALERQDPTLTAQPSSRSLQGWDSGFPGQGGSDWQVAGPCPPPSMPGCPVSSQNPASIMMPRKSSNCPKLAPGKGPKGHAGP